MKKDFLDKGQYINEKLAYQYEYFKSIDDYEKPVDNSKKEDFFSKLKNKRPSDDKIQGTKKILNNWY